MSEQRVHGARARGDACSLALALACLWLGIGAHFAWTELQQNDYLAQGFVHLGLLAIRQSLVTGGFAVAFTACCVALYLALLALLERIAATRARSSAGARRAPGVGCESRAGGCGVALMVRAASALVLACGLAVAVHYRLPIPPWVAATAGVAVALLALASWLRALTIARGRGDRVRGIARGSLRAVGALSLLSIAACLGLDAFAQHRNRAQGPNVMLVVFDAARKSNFSIYGHARETTPNVDALAREGAVFENAFAIAPFTVPNHATLFTGLYSCQHGATQESLFLPPRNLTLAEILYERGYETAAFAGNPAIAAERRYDQGFRRYFEPWRRTLRTLVAPPPSPPGDDGADRIQREFRRWLASRRPGDKPFFAFVNFLEAHSPYDPPAAFRRLFLDGSEKLNKGIVSYRYVHFLAGGYSLTPEEFAIAEALYDAEIRYADSQFAKMIEAVESAGLLDDTLLIVTSDHGEHFGEHGLVGHQFALYDTLLRVPLIVRFPSKVAPGTREMRVTHLGDIFATILDATGVEPRSAQRSQSVSLFEAADRSEIFAEYYRPVGYLEAFERLYPEFDASRFDCRMRSIRSGDLKYIMTTAGGRELFDIAADPGELDDVAAARPEALAALDAKLSEWLDARCTEATFSAAAPSESLREQLEALGYVE